MFKFAIEVKLGHTTLQSAVYVLQLQKKRKATLIYNVAPTIKVVIFLPQTADFDYLNVCLHIQAQCCQTI